MPDLVTSQPITIECVSPVHIGSGVRLGRMDFAWTPGTAWVVDPDRLIDRVGQSEQLAERFAAAACEERPELGDILRELGIMPGDIVAYKLAAGGFPGSGIWSCIKTPDRRPFIPGSSLKGSLRGTITRQRLQSDSSLREVIARSALEEAKRLRPWRNERQSRPLRETSRVVDRAFAPGNPKEQQHYDFFRVFGFGDATTDDPDALRLAEVRVLSLGQDGLREKTITARGVNKGPMRLNAEVLPIGVVLGGRIMLNRHLVADSGPAGLLRLSAFSHFLEEWLAVCNAESRRIIEAEHGFFSRGGQSSMVAWYGGLLQRLETIEPNQCVLRLGWGSGFDGTGTLNLLDPAIRPEVRARVPLGKLDSANQPVEPFPKSRKVVWEKNQPKSPLGWVVITVGERPKPVRRSAAPVPSPPEVSAPSRTPGQRPRPPMPPPRSPKPPKTTPWSAQPQQTPKTTKASEKAKREQERIRRKLRGEEP